jgi:hypothetical protein
MVWFLFLISFLEYAAGIMGDKKTRQAFPKAKMLAPEGSFRSAGASILLYKRSPLGRAK